jgi:metallo-beta-lactamase family protein
MNLALTFHGAAGTVTGSRHRLTAGKTEILVDCGLFQGLKALRLKNWEPFPFEPAGLDHVLLTHTHIDHAGWLPRLVRDGFDGPVHSTRGTRDLAKVLLLDSAKIQEEDAAHANRKKWSKHRPAMPLYTREDAERAHGKMIGMRYGKWFDLAADVKARFLNMGHILGSSMIEVQANGKTFVFSGDVGRYDMPLHPDPEPLPPCDVLVMESTYGDRDHDDEPLLDQLREPLRRTFEEGGTVLIPAFAVGRSQLITLMLCELMEDGSIPEVPIHIDSPMAVDATDLYRKYANEDNLDEDVVERKDRRTGRIYPPNVSFHRSVEESKQLNEMRGPRIVVSSSGMLAGGRVLHHLRRILPDKRNLLVLAGYQAIGTRGRALLDGKKNLKMHGKQIPVRTKFVSVHGLSAHADRNELLLWVRTAPKPPEKIFVVHGDPEATEAMAVKLGDALPSEVFVPAIDESFAI